MKFAMDGQLYRGSKPVMWSVVEKTALAEAEVEYHDYELAIPSGRSFPWSRARILSSAPIRRDLDDHAVDHPRQPGDLVLVPKTIDYGLYEVMSDAPEGNWAKVGDKPDPGRMRSPTDGHRIGASRTTGGTQRRDVGFSPMSSPV